ncbi:myb-like protein I [Teleopsis dalmanni]|uniref:myb-like protein I n=1 Tax=Teleopsis dalmanni TaxID=139649 RepID=UPI0018CCBB44|nr:myb-like protein I [Teleopsis dalmanni]
MAELRRRNVDETGADESDTINASSEKRNSLTADSSDHVKHETEQEHEHETEQEFDTNMQSSSKIFATTTITTLRAVPEVTEPTSFTDISLVSPMRSSETSVNDEDSVDPIQLDTQPMEVPEDVPEEVPEEVQEEIPEEVSEEYETELPETNMYNIDDISSSSSGKLIVDEDRCEEFLKAVTMHSEKRIIKPKIIWDPTSSTISTQSTKSSRLSFSKETKQISNVAEDKEIKGNISDHKIQELQKENDPLLEINTNSSSKSDVRGRTEEGQIVSRRKRRLMTPVYNGHSLIKRRAQEVDPLLDHEFKVSNTATDECDHLSKCSNEEEQSISINNIKSEELCNTENNAESIETENIIMTETKKERHRKPQKRRKISNSVNNNSELDTIEENNLDNKNLIKISSPLSASEVGSKAKGECGVEKDQDKNKQEQNESQVNTSVEEEFIQIKDVTNCSESNTTNVLEQSNIANVIRTQNYSDISDDDCNITDEKNITENAIDLNVTQNDKQSSENLEESSNVSVNTSDLEKADQDSPEGNQIKDEKLRVPVNKTPEPVDEKSVEISTTNDTEDTLEIEQNPQMPSKTSEKNDFKSSNESVQTVEVPSLRIKRGPKSKVASNWEHVYKQKADDDSLIVRRRSNSSYSSTTSNNLSLDISDTPNDNDINSASTTSISENSLVISSSPATATSIKSTPVSKAITKNNKTAKSNITNETSETSETEAQTTTNVKTIKSNRTKKRVVIVEPAPSTDQNSAVNEDNSFEFTKPETRINKKPGRRRKNAVLTPEVTPTTTATPALASPVSAETTKVRKKPGPKKRKNGTNVPLADIKNVKSPAKTKDGENNTSEVKPVGSKDAAAKELQNETSEEVKNSAAKKDITKDGVKNTPKVLSKETPKETPKAKVDPPVTKVDTPTVAKKGREAKPPVIPHDVVVKKSSNVAQIIFSTHKARQPHTFTPQMMAKLVEILKELSVDKQCNVVLLLSNGPNFCHGVDFTDLAHPVLEKRRQAAHVLAKATKDYLYALLTFPKPIIAGVCGSNVGLGVTQLPLFDVVVGTDKATYETPYAKIGQLPEGYCIWNNLPKIRGTYKTKLFWLCDKLHSTESVISGLLSKLSSTTNLNEVALEEAKKIAAFSPEMYIAMKKTVVLNNLNAVGTQLDAEFETIIEQWCSNKCSESFRKYIQTGHF